MPTRQEAAEFLSEFKSAVRLGFVRWLKRNSEKQHLIDLNITEKQALRILNALTPDNYCKGPEPDDLNASRSVWVFGAEVESVEAYIKIATQPDNRRHSVTHALIWSFHPAEHPLRYPLRSSC